MRFVCYTYRKQVSILANKTLGQAKASKNEGRTKLEIIDEDGNFKRFYARIVIRRKE